MLETLRTQIFVGRDQTAQVLEGKNACNVLTLSDPQLKPTPDGRLRFIARMESRSGTPLTKGRCLPLFAWDGKLEAIQTPILANDGRSIRFRVDESRALDAQGEPSTAPGVIFGWVRKKVHPRLESAHFDLDLRLREPLQVLAEAANDAPAWEPASVRAQQVKIRQAGLEVALALPSATPQSPETKASVDPEDIESLERWRRDWQALDAFLTWLVLKSASDATAAEQHALFDALVVSRRTLSRTLAEGDFEPIAAAVLSVALGALEPTLLAIANRQPARSADDIGKILFVLSQFARSDPVASYAVNAETLKRVLQLGEGTLELSALVYTTDINPELRRLAGFAAQFPLAEAAQSPLPVLEWLLPSVHASPQFDPLLVQKLNGWVADSTERDAFHRDVDTLLRSLATSLGGNANRDSTLVVLRAVAWEASCWRQFRMEGGRVQPTRGSYGELGILRLDPVVSRGLHDPHGLSWDIGYNLRAGAEWLRRESARFPVSGNAEQAADLYLSYRGKTGGDSKNVRIEKARFIASYRHFQSVGSTPPPVCETP